MADESEKGAEVARQTSESYRRQLAAHEREPLRNRAFKAWAEGKLDDVAAEGDKMGPGFLRLVVAANSGFATLRYYADGDAAAPEDTATAPEDVRMTFAMVAKVLRTTDRAELLSKLRELERKMAGADKAAAELSYLEREQRRWAETAFGRDALRLLRAAVGSEGYLYRELVAFNGCGGERWDDGAPVKRPEDEPEVDPRGSGYVTARKTLAAMAKCGLVEKLKGAKTQYRITAAGLAELRRLGL